MRCLGAALVLGLLASVAGAQEADTLPKPPEGKTWKMVWHDEFDGTKLDDSKWVSRSEGRRKGGWWSPKAISLDGKGHLAIKTYKEGDKYIDGCLVTQG